MTTYTDQPIPLAELGKMSQAGSGSGRRRRPIETRLTEVAEAEKPKPDLTLIDLVGNALAISRKVDPDRPVLLSLQQITGDHLIYDRRTGDFQVPGAGMVYLYDRGRQPGDAAERARSATSAGRPIGRSRSDPQRPGRPGDQTRRQGHRQDPAA